MAFSFGSAPATATTSAAFGGFGSTNPAPAAPAFGSAPPAAPAFGSAPPAAPAFGGGFSFNNPAAATAQQPAPSTTAGFGFGFGGVQQPAPLTPAVASAPHATTSQILNSIPGNTPYSALPEDIRREIDAIHELMKRHRHTMANVQSLAPALLVKSTVASSTAVPESAADKAAGPSPAQSLTDSTTPLPRQIADLESSLHLISTSLETCLAEVSELRSYGEHNVKSTLKYAVYPIESLAARRGILQQQHQITNNFSHLIQMLACDVDRVETIPSPYLWNTIQSVESRVKSLEQTVHSLHAQFRDFSADDYSSTIANDNNVEPLVKVTTIIKALNTSFLQVASNLAQTHSEIDTIKHRIRRILQVTGQQHQSPEDDPFKLADIKEREEELKVMGQIRNAVAKAQVMATATTVPTQQQAPAPSLFGQSAAPTPGLFGGTTAAFGAPVAQTTGLFGAPAQQPATSSVFGSTTASAPTTGLFGAQPAAVQPSTGLFGAQPAAVQPSTGLFGSQPAAVQPSTGLFGAQPATGQPSGLFGSHPAAVQPSTGLFGAQPAPAPNAFSFQQPAAAAPTTTFGSSTTTTTKSKSKTRTGRSRR